MNLEITTRHSEVAPGIKEYITDRSQRISRYFEGAERCEFVLDHEAGKSLVEIHVHAARSDLTAKFSHADVHAAVDGALDKIEQQLRRLKGKLKDHHRGERGAAIEEAEVQAVEETYEDAVKEEL